MKEREKRLYGRVDVLFCENKKIARAGRWGERVGWLHLAGILYAKRNNTDGFIPNSVAEMLTISAKKVLEMMTNPCELWTRVEGGFRIHDYEEWQETSHEIESKSEARIEAGRRGGLATAKVKSKPANASQPKQTPSKSQAKRQQTLDDPFSKNAANAEQTLEQNASKSQADEEKEILPPIVPPHGVTENEEVNAADKPRRWSTPRNYSGYYMDGFFRLYGRDPLIDDVAHKALHDFASKCRSPDVYAQAVDNFFTGNDPWALKNHHSVKCLAHEQPDRWLPDKPIVPAAHSPPVSSTVELRDPLPRDSPELPWNGKVSYPVIPER
jgi:hypothetical protein